jgi:hypothetical protein
MTTAHRFRDTLKTVASDIAHGFVQISHNGFALVGLAVMFLAITLTLQPDVRLAGQAQLFGWLQEQQDSFSGLVAGDEAERVAALHPKDLPKPQAAVVTWLSRKYNIAPEPMAALVAESFAAGAKAKVDPLLILAVMA